MLGRTRASSLLAVAIATSLALCAQADDSSRSSANSRITIPAGELLPALDTLAKQTGIELIYHADQLTGLSTRGVDGALTPTDAVAKLIEGTALQIRTDESGAMVVALPDASVDRGGVRKTGASGDTASVANAAERTRLAQVSPSEESAAPSKDSATEEVSRELAVRGIPEILVKGSRVQNMDVVRTRDDAQPYYILSSEEIGKSGATSVESFIRQKLPMDASAGMSGNYSANSTGNSSSFNLRGLGANATLILIDGRRTASPGTGFGNVRQANLNGIPMAAIERIEVLPSSAAAIYGGAAVGGVINVVLKHNYEGVDVGVKYDNTMDTDASIRTIDGVFGLSFEEGRSNVMVGGHYVSSGTLLSGDRPEFMRRGFDRVLRNNPGVLSSPTSPFATGATTNIASANGTNLTLRPEYGGMALNSPSTYVPAGTSSTTSPATLGSGLLANAGGYNFALPETSDTTGLRVTVLPAIEQSSVFASVRRSMTDNIEAFANFSSNRDTAESAFNPFGFDARVPASSPTNPFTQDVIVTSPTPTNATYFSQNETRRIDGGLLFKLGAQWTAGVDYTWNHTEFSYGGDFAAATPIRNDIAAGILNRFVDTVANPLALDAYLGRFQFLSPDSTLRDANVRLAGPVGNLPGGRPYLTIGIGHREESVGNAFGRFSYHNFPASNTVTQHFEQDQETDSAYAEARLPFVSAVNRITAVEALEVQLAARTEKYSVSSGLPNANLPLTAPLPEPSHTNYTSTNFTLGVMYRPTASVALRASYGTAFLPPSYTQLVSPSLQPGLTAAVLDPRRGGELTTVTTVYRGGNPDLEPQNSKALNVGLIWEPEAVRDLRLNLEYYRITQDDVIVAPSFSQAGFQQLVNNETFLPQFIGRDAPAPGDSFGVGRINTLYLLPSNGAEGKTDGFDLSIDYRYETAGWGAFSLSTVATLIESYTIRYPNSPVQDLLNQIGSQGPLRFRGNASLQWQKNAWTVGWQTQYFDSYDQMAAFVTAQGGAEVPSQVYHSLFADYRTSSDHWLLADLRIQAGVKNVFDSAPPFDAAYRPRFISPFGDPRMRAYWVSLNKHF